MKQNFIQMNIVTYLLKTYLLFYIVICIRQDTNKTVTCDFNDKLFTGFVAGLSYGITQILHTPIYLFGFSNYVKI